MCLRLLALLPALALVACSGGAGQRRDDTAVVVSAIGGGSAPADPSAGPLDPARRVLMGATSQGLVRFDATGQIEAGLAERWIVIDDGRSYIFRLREAQWPDGQPVTAEEVIRVLKRAIAPRSRNDLAPFLAVIDEIVEMTPQVIEVRLKHPRPDLLKLFAQPELAIFRPDRLDGSGPFRASRSGTGIALRPVPDPNAAEDAPTPQPEDTLLFHGERASLAIARFRAGESDLVLGGSFADWPLVGVSGIAAGNVKLDAPLGMFGLSVVSREGFLADPLNRGAVAMAIDRPALTHQIHPDWMPVETLLPAQLDSSAPPAQPGWASLGLDQRRQGARGAVQLWQRTHPGPAVLRVALPAGPGATLVWSRIAEALLAIGIRPVRVGAHDPADLRLIDEVAPYDSARWIVATACRPCSGDAELLVQAGRDAPDLDARAHRIAEADAALTADVSYIPIAQPFRWSIVALRLQAWQGNARAWHPLNHLRNETR